MDNHYHADPTWLRRNGMEIDEGDHHYLVLHYLNDWLVNRALPAARGKLLDYGSGGQPYRALFETKVDRYVAADVATYDGVSPDILLEPGKRVECEDQEFDTILSSQTIEHVPDPDFYMSECARILNPGGVLILTAPMQWRHHEIPYDYFRFTRYGLELLICRHGLIVEDIKSSGGVFILIGQILLNHLNEQKVYSRRLYRLVNRIALWLDKRYPDGEDVINWMCLARKPLAYSSKRNS